jgi:hypothetical protein
MRVGDSPRACGLRTLRALGYANGSAGVTSSARNLHLRDQHQSRRIEQPAIVRIVAAPKRPVERVTERAANSTHEFTTRPGGQTPLVRPLEVSSEGPWRYG